MRDQQVLDGVAPMIGYLEEHQIPYCIGGSVAASLHGYARATMDVDLMLDLLPEHVEPMVESLKSTYYVSEPMIRESLASRKCFNLIFLKTMFKVDCFPRKNRDFDKSALKRVQRKKLLGTTDGLNVWVASLEDTVLFKLEWYNKGDRISERQWKDIQELLKTHLSAIDIAYLRHWAAELKVLDLLEEALSDAGVE